jgi:hypothetical protein
MNRREALRSSLWLLVAGVAPQLLTACAADSDGEAAIDDGETTTDDFTRRTCIDNDVLGGVLPAGSRSGLSSTGQFHHHHLLSIPAAILAQPPAAGWSTLSSLMVESVGIDDFFFTQANINKQFHSHRVTLTRAELQAIAAGRRTTITAFIRSGSGQAVPNHTFTFNDTETIPQKMEKIRAVAQGRRFRMQRVECATGRAVTVFRGDRDLETIRTRARLEQLIKGEP